MSTPASQLPASHRLNVIDRGAVGLSHLIVAPHPLGIDLINHRAEISRNHTGNETNEAVRALTDQARLLRRFQRRLSMGGRWCGEADPKR